MFLFRLLQHICSHTLQPIHLVKLLLANQCPSSCPLALMWRHSSSSSNNRQWKMMLTVSAVEYLVLFYRDF